MIVLRVSWADFLTRQTGTLASDTGFRSPGLGVVKINQDRTLQIAI